MHIRRIRRITNDSNHNAFTGACWFKGELYVAFRQGDAHVCTHGRLVVMRSRNEGVSFDTVHVARGEFDTRDASLYTDDNRLFVTGFESDRKHPVSGAAWTENGLNWSPWMRYQGADGWVLWRPQYFKGRYYCAAYGKFAPEKTTRVAWFESADGIAWQQKRILRKGADLPTECALAFHPDGRAVMLTRRDFAAKRPLLLRARPPYARWQAVELKIPLAGPCLWLVDEEIWISGRWFPTPETAQIGIFKIVKDKPVFQMVMPSGPGFDCSYMGAAAHPINRHRFHLSYYSGHTAPDDSSVCQWDHPDIYVADAIFDAPFIERWKVSDVAPLATLREARCPGADNPLKSWQTIACYPEGHSAFGFIDAGKRIDGRAGVVYFVSDIDVGPCDRANLFLGYDGPLRVWVNGDEVFQGIGTNPAVPDLSSVAIKFHQGRNRIAAALDTNNGRAGGIFMRYEKA